VKESDSHFAVLSVRKPKALALLSQLSTTEIYREPVLTPP